MSGSYRLIVTDTSPLFTLVLADSLDVLLRPGLSVSIPDAVYIEATRVRGAPGADRIVEWINDISTWCALFRQISASTSSAALRKAARFEDLASKPRSRRWNDFSALTLRRGRFYFSRTPTSSAGALSSANASISLALAISCGSLNRRA